MVPSGSRNTIGEAQSVKQAFARSNSAILGSQGGTIPQQQAHSSVVSPMFQYNTSLLGSTTNISSFLNQTFGDGSASSGLSNMSGFQAGSLDSTVESHPHSVVSNEIGFDLPHSPFQISNNASSGPLTAAMDQLISRSFENGILSDQGQSQVQQADNRRTQQKQHPVPKLSLSQNQLQEQQMQLQSFQKVLGSAVPVKMEPQISNDQIGPQQHLQSIQSYGPVKLEPQHNQIVRGLGPVKLEQQHSDQALLLQQQQLMQLQQQYLQSRQSPRTALAQVNMLQQQHILQQLQQQQMLKVPPQPRLQLQSQFQQQDLPVISAARLVYEPGTCARRLAQYMYQQKCRPGDNNIEFWRQFVAEFFAPNAKKRWCLSLYGNSRQTHGLFPQDLWHCEICNCKPGRGFETTVEVLPRLFKIKYDSGTLEELLHVDMPCEYQNAYGQIVLDYAKAIQESVFQQLRVVHDGQLRVIFSPDLKIFSWEFCARHHEELIPRRFIIPQVSQLGAAAQKYQASAQNGASNSSASDLQSNCNAFVASAHQLAKTLDVSLVNDLGYTKRYVRCLQISEVVNSMKDLINFSLETGMGPMESLTKFPRRGSALSVPHNLAKKSQEQQFAGQRSKNDLNSPQANAQKSSTTNGAASVGNSPCVSTSTSAATVGGLSHQSSMNSRTDNHSNNPNSPYVGTPVQIPSTGSSTSFPPAQPNPASPFSSPILSSSNNPRQTSHNALSFSTTGNHVKPANSSEQNLPQESSPSSEIDPNESQCSADKILQEILMSSQYSEVGNTAGSAYLHSDMDSSNGLTQVGQSSKNGGNFVGNVLIKNNPIIAGCPSGGVGNFGGTSGMNLMRAALMNNILNANGRVNVPLSTLDAANYQQQELASRLLHGLNGFSNPMFEWKSP